MSKFVPGYVLGAKLAKALGLEGQPIAKISIEVSAEDPPVVHLTRLILADEVEDIATVIEHYKLAEKIEPCPSLESAA